MSSRKGRPKAGGAGAAARQGIPMRAFSESLPMALLRAREAVMRQFRPELRNHGVTEQQWRILRALAGAGELEVTELATQTCLLAPSVSRILPDLESRGLIRRRPDAADMRRNVVSLEPEGLQLIASHAPSSEGTYDAIARTFGKERLAQLFRLLRELEESVDELGEVGTRPGGDDVAQPARSRSVNGSSRQKRR